MAKLNIAPAPEPEAIPTAKASYTFDTMVFEELPDLETRGNAKSAPWADRFTAICPEVFKDGKARGFYVPLSYFVDERGVSAEKATHAYAKGKLGDAWAKFAKTYPGSDNFVMAKGNRTGKEEGYEDLGPGILVIVARRKA